MFKWLGAICMATMCSTCEHVSIFPREFWPLVLHFSLLFPFLCIFSLFRFCSRVCFFSELCPAFPGKSLELLFFFYGSSMVDYSSVRVDCPLVAFLFAHLGCLLESIGGSVLRELVFL